MRCLRFFLPFLLAALHTTQVVGFGFGGGGGHGTGYVQESAGGLVVDPQDQAERERINAEMEANTVTYGEDTEQLFTYFKSKYRQITLNMSCRKSSLVFEQEESPQLVGCNLTYNLQRSIALSFQIDYPPVAYLAPAFWLHLQPTASSGPLTIHLNLTVQGVRMGVAFLRIWVREAIKDENGAGGYMWHNWSRLDPALVEAYLSKLVNRSEADSGVSVMGLPVKILRRRGPLEVAFRAVVACLVIGITFLMGCELDPRLIWRHLRKPVGPVIGFCCQFGIMPLIAFGIAMLVPIKPEFGFGLLTVGCCPGGAGSNVWTLLLHGDLNLSMTMTFISSVAALGMTPLALFVYGRFFLDVHQIRIPYLQIAGQLLYVVIPVIGGMLIARFLPLVAAQLRKGLKPLSFLFIVVIVGFGTYVNLPIYALIGQYPLLLPTAAALPWIGFLLAGLIAFLLRRSRAEVLAIAIETGIQNIGIAILVLIYSMPQPEGDLGAVMPLIVAIFTPLPLMIVAIFVCVHNGGCCVCCRKEHRNTPLAHKVEGGDQDDGQADSNVHHSMIAVRS